MDLPKQVRIEQTVRQLERFRCEIELWLAKRRRQDSLNQYHTQLKVLEGVLTAALNGLDLQLKSLSLTQPLHQIHVSCRKFDRRLFWIRRLWCYFRDKFDQRDDPRLGPLLAAADEIVWSCYAGAFRNSNREGARLSAPLPYIESRYSPHAIPRLEPPPDLKSEIDSQFLHDYLNDLPIPVVGLPPSCVEDPWWLIYLGHEVGHHVSYDLLPDLKLLDAFRKVLATAAISLSERGEEVRSRWGEWAEEVFADAFSICCLGPWAGWAIGELVIGDEEAMVRSDHPRYPIPVARLGLMARLAEDLGVDGTNALHGVQPEALIAGLPTGDNQKRRELAAKDLTAIPGVAKALARCSLENLGPLPGICGWQKSDFMPRGRAHEWTEGLMERSTLYPEASLPAARTIVTGAVAAWAEISTIQNQGEREQKRAGLRERVLDTLRQSREEGTRAPETRPPPSKVNDLGDKLVRLLMEAGQAGLGE